MIGGSILDHLLAYPVNTNDWLAGTVNTSEMYFSSDRISKYGQLAAQSCEVIVDAGVHFTCPSSKLPLGIRLSVNSPKSCDADVFSVLAYLTADQALSPPLVVETVDFRILMSNLAPFGTDSSPVQTSSSPFVIITPEARDHGEACPQFPTIHIAPPSATVLSDTVTVSVGFGELTLLGW